MNEIYVLDRDFNLLGIIDGYVSVIWRPSYSDIGDFEIYMGATTEAVELLQRDRYVVRTSDISVDDEGRVTYKKVMIIKNRIINTDVENGDFLTVTGKELKYILHQRLIWSLTTVNGTAENAIRKYITENAISPTNTKRVIPGLVLSDPLGLTDKIEKQVTAKPLDETIIEVCNTYNYGWDICIYDNTLLFSLYQGVDRSYEQTDRPYVVFSDDFNNLHDTEYQMASENYANTALVGGEGEGVDRKYATVGDEHSGLDRYETFTDAKSTQSSGEGEETISESAYIKLLEEDGKETLKELGVTEAFTGEVVNNMGFVYEKDFYIGDIVTVINKYGISKNVRVISAIESEDENGSSLIPQFNI
jgi:hypothetical protein